jgi:hypothetical protein
LGLELLKIPAFVLLRRPYFQGRLFFTAKISRFVDNGVTNMSKADPFPIPKSFQPYLFVLKEGQGIKDDYLDYSLLMLQVTQAEILCSPGFRQEKIPFFARSQAQALRGVRAPQPPA